MKVTREYLKKLISEILRLNKDGEQEEFGPSTDIDAIYHDSTRDDNTDGYTKKGKKQFTVRIMKKQDNDTLDDGSN